MEARGTYNAVLKIADRAVEIYKNETIENNQGTHEDFANMVVDWFSSSDAPETIASDQYYQYILETYASLLRKVIVDKLDAT